jgi:hypothetical protein
MLILECSKGYYGRTDGSVTISIRNFVGEGIINVSVKGQLRMDDPEKLATLGTQDKNTTQYVLDTIISNQTQIT